MSRASLHRQTMTADRLQLSSEGRGPFCKCTILIREDGASKGLSHFDRQRQTTDRFWGKGHVRGEKRELRKPPYPISSSVTA